MQKVKEGALFGIGFTIVAISLVYAVSWIEGIGTDTGRETGARPSVKLELVDTRVEQRGDRLVVLGGLSNLGDGPIESAKLRANLFGNDDVLLDQCAEYFDETISPGTTQYFKIECSWAPDVPLENVTRHEVAILRAF